MKVNFSLDIAILTTMTTIFLYVGGYFYLEGLIYYYGFSHSVLGFNFQDYLMYGWINGMLGIFFCGIAFVIISFFNTIYKKNVYKSFFKLATLLGTFFVFFIFNMTIGLILRLLNYTYIKLINPLFKKLYYFLIKKKFFRYFLTFIELASIPFFILGLIFISVPIRFLLFLFKPALLESNEKAKKISKWNFEKDHKNIDLANNELMLHYCYLIVFYLIFLTFAFYNLKMYNNAEEQAIKSFNSSEFREIIIKDDVLESWLKIKNFNIDSPILAKVLFCGSTKCLIAIPSSQIKNVNHEQIPTKNNYYIKVIEPSNFIQIK
ncbi:hypothetical protein NOM94_01875 [Acinetobacter baumannii]|nr:hypothetical protein [Acinetobacter baumannii]